MTAAERWERDAEDDGVAHLDIPAHAHRDRTFEVFVSAVVRTGDGVDDAWHELRVLLNGAQEWSRRAPAPAGSDDSLDFRVRRTVPVGEPLRVSAVTDGARVARRSLRITAEEE